MSGPPEDSAIIIAEAMVWRVRLAETDATSTEAFEAWLAADRRHQDAWDRVDGVWALFDDHPTAPEVIAARHAALDDVRRFRRFRRRPMARTALGAGFAAVALICGAIFWLERPDDYTTALGERRVITLSDNSRVELDSGSELQVRYSGNLRDLRLVRGQAQFEVAHDARRPFHVQAGGETVIATGTNFNVDSAGQTVLVTLIEGHVEVAREDRKIELTAGEQLSLSPEGDFKVNRVDVNAVTAWENGRLIFDNEPLSAVVARVSRYSAIRVSVVDAKAATLRINGVFATGDIVGFVQTITMYLPIEATTTRDGQILLRLKS